MNALQKTNWLFDLDGTLIDSESLHDRAYRRALTQLRPEMLRNFQYSMIRGMKTTEVAERMFPNEPELANALVTLKRQAYLKEGSTTENILIPRAKELIASLVETKHRCFIVTGAARETSMPFVQTAGLLPFLSGIITGDEVNLGKPDPESYRRCLTKYNLSVETCVAIEDSPAGVESAKRCGLDTIKLGKAEGDDATWLFPTLGSLYEQLFLTKSF